MCSRKATASLQGCPQILILFLKCYKAKRKKTLDFKVKPYFFFLKIYQIVIPKGTLIALSFLRKVMDTLES